MAGCPNRLGWLLVALMVLGPVMAISAAEKEAEKGKEKEKEKEKTEAKVVKTYANMEENAVYQLSGEERTANVRFAAQFRETLTSAPNSLRSIVLGRKRWVSGGGFMTEGEVVCLISKDDEWLGKRAENLVKGQNVIIEGTVIPARVGYRVVLVDDIKLSQSEKREKRWEVLIQWPDEKPKLITQPGTYTLRLPNPDVKGKEIEFKIEVREVKEMEAK